MNAASLLTTIDPFHRLPAVELEELASRALVRTYAPREILFREGQDCTGLWVIVSGSVRIVKGTPSGREIVLTVQPAPATIAEVPVFDGGPYPATVIAQEAVKAVMIHKADFLGACRRNADLSLTFLTVFGFRLRNLVGLVERVTFGGIRQRLATLLLECASDAGGEVFVLPGTQEELAVRLGTVREVVSRNLGRFQNDGLIRMNRRTVEILDKQGLVVEAETVF